METVLVIGSTGNIGIAAVLSALRSGRNVLAVVRNSASAEKLFNAVGTRDGITTTEADAVSETGIQTVVDQVVAGTLPAFQHVYTCIGGYYVPTPLLDLTSENLQEALLINTFSTFWAYRATIPYLLKQNFPQSSWTLCTGAQGDLGLFPAPALVQGSLFSLCNVGCRDHQTTNVRFNEVYLATRVEQDTAAEKNGTVKASEFAAVYTQLLDRPDIRSSRVTVQSRADMATLNYASKVIEV